MSGVDAATLRAIADTRALLATFLTGAWSELHLSDADGEVFLARDGGGANPLRATPIERTSETPGEPLTIVTAPHVATLASTVAPGTRVAAEEVVAMLSVLDEEQPLRTPVAGTVAAIHAEPGALLDFGAVVVSIG